MKSLSALIPLVMFASCAAAPPVTDRSHPASAGAAEVPAPTPSVLERASAGPLYSPDAQAPAAGGHHGHHHGDAAAPPAPPAPDAAQPPPPAADAEIYACPMHPAVTSLTPGTCPKCGMQLKKKAK